MGQAETVRIELEGSVPLQIDGEPWEQHPAVISITHNSQVQQNWLQIFIVSRFCLRDIKCLEKLFKPLVVLKTMLSIQLLGGED